VNYNNLSQTSDGIQSYIEEGATHLILNLTAPYPDNIVHRLAEEIVAPLQAEFEGR